MSNECGPKFLTQANIYRFFSPVTFCIKNPWSRDILVLRIHSCKSNEPWNWPPTSCFRIHCWYIYIANLACHTTKCISDDYKAFPCDMWVWLARAARCMAVVVYVLTIVLWPEERRWHDTSTDVWELNDCKKLTVLFKSSYIDHHRTCCIEKLILIFPTSPTVVRR